MYLVPICRFVTTFNIHTLQTVRSNSDPSFSNCNRSYHSDVEMVLIQVSAQKICKVSFVKY